MARAHDDYDDEGLRYAEQVSLAASRKMRAHPHRNDPESPRWSLSIDDTTDDPLDEDDDEDDEGEEFNDSLADWISS